MGLKTRELIERLRTLGVEPTSPADWSNNASLLACFEAIGRSGATALLKIDGLRTDGAIYTVMVSGGRLGERFFRKDGEQWPTLIRDAIQFYCGNDA